MLTKNHKQTIKRPEVIYRDNKPVSVIIDLEDYERILERLEDIEDLSFINSIKSETLKFRKLDDFILEYNSNV